MEKQITYSEYISEQINNKEYVTTVTDYSNYLVENLEKSITYSDYIAENLYENLEKERLEKVKFREERLDKLLNKK